MNRTDFWICDKCGKKIESIEDGWVEWMTLVGENHSKNMRIVHRVDCLFRHIGSRICTSGEVGGQALVLNEKRECGLVGGREYSGLRFGFEHVWVHGLASILSDSFQAGISCDSRSLLPCQSSDLGVKLFGESFPSA